MSAEKTELTNDDKIKMIKSLAVEAHAQFDELDRQETQVVEEDLRKQRISKELSDEADLNTIRKKLNS